jgi:hypothetical protein
MKKNMKFEEAGKYYSDKEKQEDHLRYLEANRQTHLAYRQGELTWEEYQEDLAENKRVYSA